MPGCKLLSLTAALASLLAGPHQLLAGTVFQYGFDTDTSNFVSLAGWDGAYCSDNWTTALNGGVCPLTDNGCSGTVGSNCSGANVCPYDWAYYANCTNSDPVDNHIHVGSTLWQDYIFESRFRNADDDTMGMVFRYKNSGQFYLLLFTRSRAPSAATPQCAEQFVGSRLYRILDTTGVQIAASSVTYTQNATHKVRITVIGNHIKIDFDANADGQYGNTETLFDLDVAPGLDSGKVGFYAYDNGAADAPCNAGGCWFDDLSVELLEIAPDPCGGISYEGVCEGNTLLYCQNGQLITQQCDNCCMWSTQGGYYACGQQSACASCQDECSVGQAGCSESFTHSWLCGQADNDSCLERIYTYCAATLACDVATGGCVGACEPQCAGKQCGPDGCGGSCGQCQAGYSCDSNGQCACIPQCTGKQCGPNGCGGVCGECPPGHGCTPAGLCTCTPDCAGKECGPDGCGGSCGGCPVGLTCQGFLCLCPPKCTGKQCGPDGCGGSCGQCPGTGICTDEGLCQCTPDCAGKECGPDGCGGSCGSCEAPKQCIGGACLCLADCTGKQCGPDGCGGSCGQCPDDTLCTDGGQCACQPLCDGLECGPDGCGGVCGNCLFGESCVEGLCLCVPTCGGKECGPDLCGGICGTCPEGKSCEEGQCLCAPDCTDQECGDDGCGELCATCPEGEYCEEGKCQEGECDPICDGKECGFDGCNGLCGECGEGFKCEESLCVPIGCLPSCEGRQCGPDGCEGSCGECPEGQFCDEPSGQCQCQPECEGVECGPDGCGGLCGECFGAQFCHNGECVDEVCVGDCTGKECGNDGCGGVCGLCDPGMECTPEGECHRQDCAPKSYKACAGNDLFWFDSCDQQQELIAMCPHGCAEGSCLGVDPEDAGSIPGEHDTISEDGAGAGGGETVNLDNPGGKKAGGCNSAKSPALLPPALLLLLALTLGVLRLARREH